MPRCLSKKTCLEMDKGINGQNKNKKVHLRNLHPMRNSSINWGLKYTVELYIYAQK
jgi:hypothetical protein